MQEYFKEMTDQDIRRRIYDEQRNQIEQDMAPFGFIDDGLGDDTFVDADGEFSGKCCDNSSVSGGNGCACITKEQQCYLNSRGGNRTSDSEY